MNRGAAPRLTLVTVTDETDALNVGPEVLDVPRLLLFEQ